MMKKRISILSLTLLFLFSTTGLPVTYHLCEMMGEKSLNECEVCKIEMQKVETSCCVEDKVQEPITISSENPICCQDEFVFNKVEDDFIYTKSDVNVFSSSENLFYTITLVPPFVDFSKETSFYGDSSPPFLIDSEIHITNHSLLI